ncbi:MAG: HEAT repeat domain-containing protein [Anaerolineae bacterium]|nr:MAG: HEAT repeat domain-containing protein [Anaerolineae bacterium]
MKPENTPEILRPLVEAALQGNDSAAEKAAADLLQAGAASPENILPLLDSPHPDLRWWGARLLGETYHPAAFDALLRALQDPSTDVQQCAALGLRHHALHGLDEAQARRAVAALLPLLDGEDRLLRSLTGQALSALGASAVPALLQTLQDGAPAARLTAMRALAVIGDTRAIPAMFQAVSEEETALIRHWAEQGLEKMGVGMMFFKPS